MWDLFSPLYLIARPRFFFDQNSIYYDYRVQAGSLSEKGYSFPSGHATSIAAFAMGLFLAFNKKWSWSFLWISFLMGYTRIYFSVHYASDIVGGIFMWCFKFFDILVIR